MEKPVGYAKDVSDGPAPSFVHVNCGGDIMVDATGEMSFAVGFGYVPDHDDPVVDSVEMDVVRGGCMKCRTDGVFTIPTTAREKREEMEV